MKVLGFIVLGLAIASVLWAMITAMTARWFRIPLLSINFLAGPSFRVGSVGRVPINVGFLPLTSSVELLTLTRAESVCNDQIQRDLKNQDLSAEKIQEIFDECVDEFIDGRPVFEQFPLHQRLGFCLVGWMVLYLLASLMIGFPEALEKIVDTYPQLFQLLIDREFNPVNSFSNQIANRKLAEAFGTLAMKMTAISLLPFPGVSGGLVIEQLASSLLKRRFQFTFGGVFFFFSTLIGSVIFIDRVLTFEGESPLTVYLVNGVYLTIVVGVILWNSREQLRSNEDQ